MFRLNDRQLHILLGLLVATTLLTGCFFGWRRGNSFLKGEISVLSDLSEGFVATYKTTDKEKWKQYRKEDDDSNTGVISEVINLPNDFQTDDKVTLTQKIPDTSEEKQYLVFTTDGQRVNVSVNKEELFDTEKNGDTFSYHIVEIPYEYRNQSLNIEVFADKNDQVHFDSVKIGSFNELIGTALHENGFFAVSGILFVMAGIVLLIMDSFVKALEKSKNKQLLTYSALQGVSAGLLMLFESRLIRVLINSEYLSYFILQSLVVIAAVLHLLVFRCRIKKKKILTVVDFGVIFFCIAYVSGMVLQWFGLLAFDSIYRLWLVLYCVSVIVYTFLMGTASYDYRQKDGKPVFAANVLLIISIAIELLLTLTGSERVIDGKALATGMFVYFAILWVCGIKTAVYVEEKKEDDNNGEQLVRERVIEQFNPNLLFASFQTLQNLIKKDSNQSVKMIYYISVYVKNNLRAINNQGEIIAFEEELEHIMSYLRLQQVRNANLGFALECKVKNFKVPRNTIEPIVENAVMYGIAGKNNRGNVVVRSYEREDGYAIQIIDDGIGFDSSRLKKNSSTSLKNVLGILEDTCKAQTEIISKDKKGTVITIVLPILDNDLL